MSTEANVPVTETPTAAAVPTKSKSAKFLEVEAHKPHAADPDNQSSFTINGKKHLILVDKRYVAKTGKSDEKVIVFYRPEYTAELVADLAAEAVIRKGPGADQVFYQRLLNSLFEDATEYATATDASGNQVTDDAKIVEYLAVDGRRKSGTETLAELTKQRFEVFETMANLSTTPVEQLSEKWGIANERTAQAMKLMELKKRADQLSAQIEAKHQAAEKRKAGKKAKTTAAPAAPVAA